MLSICNKLVHKRFPPCCVLIMKCPLGAPTISNFNNLTYTYSPPSKTIKACFAYNLLQVEKQTLTDKTDRQTEH